MPTGAWSLERRCPLLVNFALLLHTHMGVKCSDAEVRRSEELMLLDVDARRWRCY